MPQPRREHSRDTSAEIAARIVTGPDPDRFYCPNPGCNRSFAELWRLKVHFRAPPDVRGSGKERGHGTELKYCPKCGKELKAGKHHVGCSAGKSAPRQAAKRQRQVSVTESEWITTTSSQGQSLDQEEGSDSWEDTVRRRVDRVHRQRSLETESSHRRSVGAPPQDTCRVSRMQQTLSACDGNNELIFTENTMADFGLILRGGPGSNNSQHVAQAPPVDVDDRAVTTLAGHVESQALDNLPFLRAPSPPPLPSDWDFGPGPHGPSGLLFDFDQFDASRRSVAPGVSEPLMTVTTAINPHEIANPSDDYIWQILFAGENDTVPKRVTAHLHHPPQVDPQNVRRRGDDLSNVFDEPDPILDAIPWPKGELVPSTEAADAGRGTMNPPPPREPVEKSSRAGMAFGADGIPPVPPAEALELVRHEGEAQTVTVTYIVKPGPAGTQYAVKSVSPGTGDAAMGSGQGNGHAHA